MMDSIINWNWNTIFLAIIAILSCIFISSCAGKAPTTIGDFSDCPGTPNCVSTKNINTNVETKKYIAAYFVKNEIPTKIPKIKKLIFKGFLIVFKKKSKLIDQKNTKKTSVDNKKEEKLTAGIK